MITDLNQSNIIYRAQWALETKIKVWIGLKNTIDTINYPDIIYFPMGEYYLSSFNSTINNSNITISLQGKDKMSLLNGDLGGTFTTLTTDLGKMDILDENGKVINTEELEIKQIITNLVHDFGREPYHNIIIKDIEDAGLELLEYHGDEPLYIFKNSMGECEQWTTNGMLQIVAAHNPQHVITINHASLIYEVPGQKTDFAQQPTKIYLVKDNEPITSMAYTIIKVEYGQTCGYRTTPLVYAGDLIMNQGNSVTEALDKIVNFLGPYEYFYNLDGQFVFQKQAASLSLNSIELNQDGVGVEYIQPLNDIYSSIYNLSNNELISSLNNNVMIQQIKNDFTIWGQRNNSNLHLRYAIDKKPQKYTTYDNVTYSASKGDNNVFYDWREILYQMALDENRYKSRLDFREKLIEHNPEFPTGYTGYEQYYVDILGFWRDLYNPNPLPYYTQVEYNNSSNELYTEEFVPISQATSTIERDQLYIYDKNTNEMIRWVDSLDFSNLNLSNGSITNELDNMYYYVDAYPVKIIDSIDYNNNQLYVLINENEMVPYYAALTHNLQDCIYLGNQKPSSATQKYLGYHSLLVYQNDNIRKINTDTLYINLNKTQHEKVDTSQWYHIHEITLILDNTENEITIWQYNSGIDINSNMINILREAITNYGKSLVIYVQGLGRITYQSDNIIAIYGALEPENQVLWYKENKDAEPILLTDKVLAYNAIKQDDYYTQISKYDLYLGDNLQRAPYYINIDKSKIYWELTTSSATSRVLEPVMNCVTLSLGGIANITTNDNSSVVVQNLLNNAQEYIISSANIEIVEPCYIKTQNKIMITKTSPLYNLYYNNKDERREYFFTTIKNIYGTASIFAQDNNLTKKIIPWYQKCYDYLLSSDGQDYSNCWNSIIYNDFNQALFWLDFLDTNGEINKFNVRNIGTRIKSENNSQVTGIDFGQVPNILWVNEPVQDQDKKTGYSYVLISDSILELFVISTQGRSCLNVISEWLSSATSLAQTVSFNCLPLWHLDVGNIIELYTYNNEKYEIERITIPLQYNGTMSVSATKIINNTILN